MTDDAGSTLRHGVPGRALPKAALCTALLMAAAQACAGRGDALADLINAYRAAPGSCAGRPATAAAPLTPQAPLSHVRLDTGLLLQHALERAGYKPERAEVISVSGPPDARSAMAAIQQKYCRVLLNPQFTDVGTTHRDDEWLVVLARPFQPLRLPDWPDAGRTILEAVNAARATARTCGSQRFAAAPPVAWNDLLGNASLAHSRDMAQHRYFSHEGKDGSQPGDRAHQAGYHWLRVGENIASGLGSPEEAVVGWLNSPGHCANLMNPGFTEMGAAYAINPASEHGTVYWTQLFATPR